MKVTYFNRSTGRIEGGMKGMEKKSINFWETSNMAVQIRRLCCPECEGEFYEIDDHALEDCPICHVALFDEPETMEWDSTTYTLIVDHKTGVPSVIRNDEYEPVVRDSAIESDESAQEQAGGRIGGSHE